MCMVLFPKYGNTNNCVVPVTSVWVSTRLTSRTEQLEEWRVDSINLEKIILTSRYTVLGWPGDGDCSLMQERHFKPSHSRNANTVYECYYSLLSSASQHTQEEISHNEKEGFHLTLHSSFSCQNSFCAHGFPPVSNRSLGCADNWWGCLQQW